MTEEREEVRTISGDKPVVTRPGPQVITRPGPPVQTFGEEDERRG